MAGNVRSVLEELGYNNISEHPKEYRMSPLYRDSKNPTVLSVRKDSGRWIDYAMGATGDLQDLVLMTLKLKDPSDAIQWLQNKDVDIRTIVQAPRPKITMPEFFDKECLARLGDDSSYWENRGISLEVLKRFGGGVAYKGKLAGRYIFPIYDSRENLVGFAGRDIFNNSSRAKWKLIGAKDKWVYPASFNAKQIINSKVVVLVESIGDCLALFHAGIENVLVTFGLSLGSGILNFLIRADLQHIIISFNNDKKQGEEWGNQAAEKIRQKLLCYFDVQQVNVVLPDAKDFGDMSVEDISLWKKKNPYLQAV